MRMQLDGPDLEELLVRARHEYGSDVRIVQADKVRSGGLGGFFARERYQLSVEVDAATSTESAAAELGTAALLDLADAISDRESTVGAPESSRDDGCFTPGNPGDDGSTPGIPGDDGFTPGIPGVAAAGPALSTDSETFADVLARLTKTVGPQAPAPAAAAPTRAELVPEPIRGRPVFAAPAAQHNRATPARRRPRQESLPALSMHDLRGLGLPPALLADAGNGDLLGTLVGALRALPPAPPVPNGAGVIVAVVGDGDVAWDAGVQVVRSIGLDERAMVYVTAGQAPARIAPARRVTGIEQLATRLDRWRKRATPTVAVLDAPMSVQSAWWNRRALATLRPQGVWLVVPATRKTADVAGWVHRLGRADALIVTDVDSSADPASVLQLGVPVALLDGRPATPGAWAGVLVDRLVAAR